MYLHYQLMKTLQDERLRAAARDHLAAEARRARTAGRDHAAARGVTAGADGMAGVQLAGMKEQVPALRMIGLHKAFRETVAVDHVDLTVPSGSFFGLVGPNGAGKTTALLMAVGLLRPDAGRSEVLGVDVQADPMRARQLMGVLPDGLAMPERLTGRELLTLIGEMRGLDPDVIAQRTRDLLEVMGLTGAERTLIVDYSAGMAFIRRLWRDWSPGFDAADCLEHVRVSLADPANLLAAISYYRAPQAPDSPGRAGRMRRRRRRQHGRPSQPTLYLHGTAHGCISVTSSVNARTPPRP